MHVSQRPLSVADPGKMKGGVPYIQLPLLHVCMAVKIMWHGHIGGAHGFYALIRHSYVLSLICTGFCRVLAT